MQRSLRTCTCRDFARATLFPTAARLPRPAHSIQHSLGKQLHTRRVFYNNIVAQARRGLAELVSLRDKKEARPRLQPGKVAPELPVPAHIQRPPYAANKDHPPWIDTFEIHNTEGVQKMREAGRLAAQVLNYAGTLVKPGITTDEIDRAVHQMCIENDAYPSPLRYGAFPKSVCTSVNECICHGIPDSRALEDGDIINIDVTVYLNGYHGDTSRMFLCGNVGEKHRRLCSAVEEAVMAAIKECGPGVPFSRIGAAVQRVADRHKFNVNRSFVGHGVGRAFHASPAVLPYRNNEPDVMQVGQTFTIEPILVEAGIKTKTWADRWTVVSADGGWAAQMEHTLLITPNGVDILTLDA